MSEEEAKTKWCPQSMASDNWDMCQGSACMAWRWLFTPEMARQFNSSNPGDHIATAKGYCGLAGKQ